MKKLPKSIVNQLAMERLQKEFDNKQELLQKHVAEISRLRNMSISSVEQLEAISHKWLEDEIAKSQENLRTIFHASGGFVPAGISEQFNDEYNRVRKECFSHIDEIANIRDWCKVRGIGIKIDSKGRPWLNEKDVKEAILKESSHTFSEEEKHYYELLANLFDAINEIHRYEESKGLAHSELHSIIREQDIARTIRSETDIRLKEYRFTPEVFHSLLCYGKVCRREANQ